MSTPARGDRCVVVLAVIAWSWAGATGIALAQPPAPADDQQASTPPAITALTARLPIGDVVYVTDTTGATIRGRLAWLTAHTVQVKLGGSLRSIPATDIRGIQWQRPDSPLTGVLIGAAVGAVPGLYYLAVDPNECHAMCAEEYALIAIGAVVGGLFDFVHHGRVTVYPVVHAADSITIGPLLKRDRKGVQVAVTF